MSDPDPIPWVGTPTTPPAVEWIGSGIVTEPVPIEPPLADGSWCDPATTLDHVLSTLRLDPADPDAAAVTEAMSAAITLIDQFLDRTTPLPGPPPPNPVQQAVEQLTIELYRRKDAPFAMLNTTLPEDIALDIANVPALQPITALIQPYKQRWGYA